MTFDLVTPISIGVIYCPMPMHITSIKPGLDTNGGPGTRGSQILARTTSSFKLGGPPGEP
ncbi:hypothetical protein DPMN_102970 [Dreissena polymorpha]|uniref:Uncharacterized protein n=1 Tax=Dreissena polymorpha TaxID=45954 RepID=A0A9D4HDL1_DREPO|nr:hypothetical protein DPMN_102970 [Dreissena polymorpha]